ncbi:MAG TPA: hypothetical protein VFT46_09035 [Holophagaceae bacterium]|nr:hypothetical protein [Holophagaceae bacterium]
MKKIKAILLVVGGLIALLAALIFIPAYLSARRRSDQLQKEQYGDKNYRQAPPPR